MTRYREEIRAALKRGDGEAALAIQDREARAALDDLGLDRLPVDATWSEFRDACRILDAPHTASPYSRP